MDAQARTRTKKITRTQAALTKRYIGEPTNPQHLSTTE